MEQVETNPRNDNEILSKWHLPDNTTQGGYPFVLAVHNKGNSKGKVIGRTNGGSVTCPSRNINSKLAINDDMFHHVVLVRKSGSLILYIDGIEDERVAENYNPDCTTTNIAPLRIGQSDDLDNFKGVIDDIRIYNRALTEAEIKLLNEEK